MPDEHPIPVRDKAQADQAWVDGLLTERWGGRAVLLRGKLVDAGALPALVAGDRLGLATFTLSGDVAELVTLDAVQPSRGVGTALVEALWARLGALAGLGPLLACPRGRGARRVPRSARAANRRARLSRLRRLRSVPGGLHVPGRLEGTARRLHRQPEGGLSRAGQGRRGRACSRMEPRRGESSSPAWALPARWGSAWSMSGSG